MAVADGNDISPRGMPALVEGCCCNEAASR